MAAAAAPPPHKMARARPLLQPPPPRRHGFLGAAGEGRERPFSDRAELRETWGCFREGLPAERRRHGWGVTGGRGHSPLPSSLQSWLAGRDRRGGLLTPHQGRARWAGGLRGLGAAELTWDGREAAASPRRTSARGRAEAGLPAGPAQLGRLREGVPSPLLGKARAGSAPSVVGYGAQSADEVTRCSCPQ